jgi:hypothetical protein
MPGTRGAKNPALLVETRSRTAPALVYLCGARPLKFGDYTLSEGVEVPGAADWPRLEAWVGARSIRPAYAGEEYTSFEEFKARVDAERAEAEAEALAAELKAAEEAELQGATAGAQ